MPTIRIFHRPGVWFGYSKISLLWNFHVRGKAVANPFIPCPEGRIAINRMKKHFGEPPSDFKWGYILD